MKKFAAYGSLRKGFYNHAGYGLGEPIATSVVQGAMYMDPMLGYPQLYESGDPSLVREHVVEIYEVSDALFFTLDRMEQGAGYVPKLVPFVVDEKPVDATVWFYDPRDAALPEHWIEKYA